MERESVTTSESPILRLNPFALPHRLEDWRGCYAWLEEAYDERSVWLIWLGVDPKFDPLRDDPRLKNLLRRMGF
jgi:hypothetical protein